MIKNGGDFEAPMTAEHLVSQYVSKNITLPGNEGFPETRSRRMPVVENAGLCVSENYFLKPTFRKAMMLLYFRKA